MHCSYDVAKVTSSSHALSDRSKLLFITFICWERAVLFPQPDSSAELPLKSTTHLQVLFLRIWKGKVTQKGF